MSVQDKIPIMKEWYGLVHQAMLQEDITRDAIQKAVAHSDTIQLRPGMEQMIEHCQSHQPPIPFFIMSAGLGDVIEEFLRQRLPFDLSPSTTVASNRMTFDDRGKLISFSEPLLHMFNKTIGVIQEFGGGHIETATCALLLGDGVGDLTMAEGEGANFETVLKIGFLNEKVEERIDQYLGPFDVVVTHDGDTPEVCFEALGLGKGF